MFKFFRCGQIDQPLALVTFFECSNCCLLVCCCIVAAESLGRDRCRHRHNDHYNQFDQALFAWFAVENPVGAQVLSTPEEGSVRTKRFPHDLSSEIACQQTCLGRLASCIDWVLPVHGGEVQQAAQRAGGPKAFLDASASHGPRWLRVASAVWRDYPDRGQMLLRQRMASLLALNLFGFAG